MNADDVMPVATRKKTKATDKKEEKNEGYEKGSELSKVMADVAKAHGDKVLHKAKDLRTFQHFPFGIFTLDMALFGGMPRSLITQVFGWESCIASDTYIKYIVVNPENGKVQDCKGGTIERLYHRFNNTDKNHWQKKQTINSDFYVMGINERDRVIRNPIADVVKTGKKECFKVLTKAGFAIEATEDHKFYVGGEYKQLKELHAGSIVYIHNNTPHKGRKKYVGYVERCVKWYYKGKEKVLEGKYVYYRVSEHRLVYEADMNGLTLNEYVDLLNSGIRKLPDNWITIPEGFHVHHIDECRRNNELSNLELIDSSSHSRRHSVASQDNLRFVAVPDQIVSIESVGMKETYDIKCFHPYNNFVAAGFVVHNCGKTTVSMRAIASAQRLLPDETAIVIDAEGTWDNNWAEKHGVDTDRLLLVSPETGEQAVDIADALLRARDTSLVVVDSLPALIPLKELEKSVEDDIVAMQARLIGRFLKKATQALTEERKRGHLPSLLLINQWRNKIAFMGDNRSLPGGNALKFAASVSVEILNKEILGKDDRDIETVDYNEHSFKIRKNKLGTGMRSGEFLMIRNPDSVLGAGFVDDAKTVITYAKKFGLFRGGGSSWKLDGVDKVFNTHQEVADWMYENTEQFEALKFRLITLQRERCGLRPTDWLANANNT